MNTRATTAAILFWVSLALPNAAWSQVDTGTIRGTVTDASGRAVPNAQLSVKSAETGLSLNEATNGEGAYVFPPLRAGAYSVSVSAPGFTKETRSAVTLDVQQNAVVDFELKPGEVSTTVEVSAASPLLQTQDASVGQVFTAQEIDAMPLNGRNYTLLAQLTTGTTTPVAETRGLTASGSFVANGVPSIYNTYILDGITNNNNTVDFLNGAAYVVKPPVDAIREFKVQTSNFSSEFGRAAGAVVNAVLKSGTNQFHGDAWEFIRNDAMDGTDFFLNAGGQKKGEFRRNQFGFTVGGPVWIPRLYNGKNKTFIFGDYEGTRIRQAVPFVDSVPTANERNSGFTNYGDLLTAQGGTQKDLLGRTFALGTVFDPATTRTVTSGQVDPTSGMMPTGSGYVRDPFPNNIVPASRLDPVAVKLLSLFPAPNNPGIVNNMVTNPIKSINNSTMDIRLDHNFSEKDQTFLRVSMAWEPPVPADAALGETGGRRVRFAEGNQNNDVMNLGLERDAHILDASTVSEVRVGYSHVSTTRLRPSGIRAA